MAQGQAELDAALATLSVSLKAVQDAVTNHKPGAGPDLTSEVAGINSAAVTLSDIATKIAGL